jgi:hypothetical protein
MTYHTILVRDTAPECLDFASREELQTYLSTLPKDGYIFVFRGDRLHVTQGQFRFLVEDDKPLPLFPPPEPGPIAEDGCLEPTPEEMDDQVDPEYARLTRELMRE